MSDDYLNAIAAETTAGRSPLRGPRLITCGTLDPLTGHYLSNAVVYATLLSRTGKAVPPAGDLGMPCTRC